MWNALETAAPVTNNAVIDPAAHISAPHEDGPLAKRETMCLISVGLCVELEINQPGVMNLSLSGRGGGESGSGASSSIRKPAGTRNKALGFAIPFHPPR